MLLSCHVHEVCIWINWHHHYWRALQHWLVKLGVSRKENLFHRFVVVRDILKVSQFGALIGSSSLHVSHFLISSPSHTHIPLQHLLMLSILSETILVSYYHWDKERLLFCEFSSQDLCRHVSSILDYSTYCSLRSLLFDLVLVTSKVRILGALISLVRQDMILSDRTAAYPSGLCHRAQRTRFLSNAVLLSI